MKKVISAMFCTTAAVIMAACQSQTAETSFASETTTAQASAEETTAEAETLTGSGEGFGGQVTAVLTMEDGKITACILEGKDETPELGGKALEELERQVVDANGYEVDGVAGATVTSKAVRTAVARALGEEAKETETKVAETAKPAQIIKIDGGLQIGQVYAVGHSTNSFAEAVAVVQDDVIVAAYVDEFQFMENSDGVVGVPNSDGDFAEAYADGVVLISKRENAGMYSDMMVEYAKSTVSIDGNYDAIQNFAVGKTIDEVAAVAGGDNAVDAVSGATLVDVGVYLQAIVDAANVAKETQAVEYSGSSEDLKLNVAYGAAHGTKCFTTAAALADGDNIILSYIDDFQFLSPEEGIKLSSLPEKPGENLRRSILGIKKGTRFPVGM